MLAAACLDWIPRRIHTPSGLLVEEGISTRIADVPGADDLVMLVCVAIAQNERELMSERTGAAPVAAQARETVRGGDRRWGPPTPLYAVAAAQAWQENATRTAHWLALEMEALRAEGVTTHLGLARALMTRGVPTSRGGVV